MDSASENTAATEAPRSPGNILADERERQALSRADIAQRLHMSVFQVEALEIGDYDRLPRGTFLRGFTRNYARALGLDAEFLVGLLAQDAPREKVPDIVVPTQNIRFDPLGQRLANPYVKAAGIAAAALVLGFAAMYWWLFVRPGGGQASVAKQAAVEVAQPAQPQPAPAVPAEPAPTEAGSGVPATTPGSNATPGSGNATPATTTTATTTTATTTTATTATATMATTPAPAFAAPAAPAFAPAASAPAAPPPVAATGEGLLRLTFRGAAWVEIHDARGKVLLSRTHPGGSSAEVAGKPPFTLVIGNAPEVRLSYNGRDVDLAPHTRVAVARFTLP
jgi:cytoskeleton protein RodZ